METTQKNMINYTIQYTHNNGVAVYYIKQLLILQAVYSPLATSQHVSQRTFPDKWNLGIILINKIIMFNTGNPNYFFLNKLK